MSLGGYDGYSKRSRRQLFDDFFVDWGGGDGEDETDFELIYPRSSAPGRHVARNTRAGART